MEATEEISKIADVNSWYVAKKLKGLWVKNSLEKMKKKNTDKCYIIDGRERIGKSLFTIQQACYLEPGLLESPEKLVSRICFSPEEFHTLCRNVKNGVIIFDEAFRGLSSRAAMSKTNKKLIQTLMEMGQQNNIVFIVLPSFFMLDVYPAMLRSDGLFNIYEERKTGKRSWRGYNRKDKNRLYQLGLRRGWNYILGSKFRHYFYGKFPGGEEFEKAYLKKKAHALHTMFGEGEKEDKLLEVIRKDRESGLSYAKLSLKYGIHAETIRRWLIKG